MPQLQPGDFAPQLIWLAIVFIGLYLVLSRVALPRIGSVIDEREARIAGDLAQARALKDETDKAIAAYEQALADARGKAGAIANKTRDDLNAKLAAERAEIDKRIASKSAQAEAEITRLRESSQGQVEAIAIETAEAIVERLTGVKAGKPEISAALAGRGDI